MLLFRSIFTEKCSVWYYLFFLLSLLFPLNKSLSWNPLLRGERKITSCGSSWVSSFSLLLFYFFSFIFFSSSNVSTHTHICHICYVSPSHLLSFFFINSLPSLRSFLPAFLPLLLEVRNFHFERWWFNLYVMWDQEMRFTHLHAIFSLSQFSESGIKAYITIFLDNLARLRVVAWRFREHI